MLPDDLKRFTLAGALTAPARNSKGAGGRRPITFKLTVALGVAAGKLGRRGVRRSHRPAARLNDACIHD